MFATTTYTQLLPAHFNCRNHGVARAGSLPTALLTHNNHIPAAAERRNGTPAGQSMEFVMHTRCGARACDYGDDDGL